MRNRVSAQQARERKKRYINDLEQQLQDKESELSAVKTKMQDVTSDNMTLRRLITTMRGANTLPAHPANSSCMPGQAPPASPNRTRRVSNTYVEEDQQAHKWHVSEVCCLSHPSIPVHDVCMVAVLAAPASVGKFSTSFVPVIIICMFGSRLMEALRCALSPGKCLIRLEFRSDSDAVQVPQDE